MDDEDDGLRWAAEPEDGAGTSQRRGGWLVAVLLLVVAGLLVVGIRAVVPHGGEPAAAAPTTAAPTTPEPTAARAPGTASSTPSGAGDQEVAETTLTRGGRPDGRLVVSVGTPVTGHLPPHVTNFAECGATAGSVEYLPVLFRPSPYLDATVTVRPGPGTRGTGRLGFFFESSNDDAHPCAQQSHWPTADTFEAVNGKALVTGYVVLDQAVTAATPQGRPDVLAGLQVQVSRFRELDGYGVWQPITPGTPTVGTFCPGTRTAVCASLG